ncbi:hypothetical protein GA0061096_3570 [Fictibacillus enclensis]|uniref:Uncharacterized protein n=1 Tax=Fictibacillus enclensis TaxID=1017270 RepID=A0A0V8J4S4_9BACL|nr:hypothetical protein [Fictibacillus enclensis]KSU81974.1 hypothetical protein AS030_16980 [Fictibacillus enclensis]SCC28561.1 hypothetical protein GA0061096_3570 [Fictibacillus enclensis]
MNVPEELLAVWRRFDDFPMENLTKAWCTQHMDRQKQREVSLMKEHHEQYGMTGNCFDLALWLLHDLKEAGIKAYGIGRGLMTDAAHVAVIALDEEGRRYLCDLGDQWLSPIPLDAESPDEKWHRGFFPAAEIRTFLISGNEIEVHYLRPNGKVSKQVFDTGPIDEDVLWEAADYSQKHIKSFPHVECRVIRHGKSAHWEMNDWQSFFRTDDGIILESPAGLLEEWASRIVEKTGIHRNVVEEALRIYEKIG